MLPHIVIQPGDEAVLFKNRYEMFRGHQPCIGMLPAYQRFRPDIPVIGNVKFRLEIHHELFLIHGSLHTAGNGRLLHFPDSLIHIIESKIGGKLVLAFFASDKSPYVHFLHCKVWFFHDICAHRGLPEIILLKTSQLFLYHPDLHVQPFAVIRLAYAERVRVDSSIGTDIKAAGYALYDFRHQGKELIPPVFAEYGVIKPEPVNVKTQEYKQGIHMPVYHAPGFRKHLLTVIQSRQPVPLTHINQRVI